MKRILVPTDFSPNALKAALYAAEIARRSGASLYLVHAPELGGERVHQPFRLHDKYNQLVTDDRLQALHAFGKDITDVHNDILVLTALIEGPVVAAICRYCTSNEIDLVVMGTKGASGLKEVLIGSVTAQVMAKTKVPVLAVPETYVYEKPDAILLATNHFEQRTALLNGLVDVAKIFSAAIHVIAFMDVDGSDAGSTSSLGQQLHQYVELLKSTFKAGSFTGEVLEGSDFEAALERYEIKNAINIVAVIAYPKGFWERLLQKSTTRKIAFHSRIPILAIPANVGEPRTTAPEGASHDP